MSPEKETVAVLVPGDAIETLSVFWVALLIVPQASDALAERAGRVVAVGSELPPPPGSVDPDEPPSLVPPPEAEPPPEEEAPVGSITDMQPETKTQARSVKTTESLLAVWCIVMGMFE